MQLCERLFQQDMVVIGAADIARPAGAGAALVDGDVHGCEHRGVLPHAQVVVGAPHGDIFSGALAVRPVAIGSWELSGASGQVGK